MGLTPLIHCTTYMFAQPMVSDVTFRPSVVMGPASCKNFFNVSPTTVGTHR